MELDNISLFYFCNKAYTAKVVLFKKQSNSRIDSLVSNREKRDMHETLNIVKAGLEEIEQVATLFDSYRQFYQQEADLELAKDYIEQRMKTDSSVIYLALDKNNQALGFTQLYPSFCSVDASPIWILYDLFVDKNARRKGIGKALMARALQLATETGASRIDLETAKDNKQAQALYQALAYERDNQYYKYCLEL